ncbi:hypothetical protein DSO57_1014156 [Entomophthora muscae]|uniref:Uncharacterized protein n=1 Tax=Entomophthora muscae TaxID=34485 RepID=A0ACC2RWQ3_9FUNG|nr:hypothetical protein DSO57_1014156 [Entomophthora muscae]
MLTGSNNSCGTLACNSLTHDHEETANDLLSPGHSAQFPNCFASITENDAARPLVEQKAKYSSVGIIYFCTNKIILLASLCESTTQCNHAYLFPPGSAPVTLVKPSCTIDLEFFHPHHLNLPPGHPRVPIPPTMKEIPSSLPLPNVSLAQDFSKLGFVYITVLGLADQAVPHNRSWHLLATAVNYINRIALIVHMAFQAWPASPVGVQPGSGMSCDSIAKGAMLNTFALQLWVALLLPIVRIGEQVTGK